MKKITKIISITALISYSILAQPAYIMNLSSPQIIDNKTIEFDINIESTGQDFVLTSYQCAFNIDSIFLNDTSFCFEYIPSSSQLNNTPLYGVGCDKVDGTRKIHFASSAGIDNITTHPIRVGRFLIKKSSSILVDSLHINWTFDGIYKTILTGENFIEITNPLDHKNLLFKNDSPSIDYLVLDSDEGTLNGDVHLKTREGSNSSKVVYFLNTSSTLTYSIYLNKSGEWFAWGRMFFESTSSQNSFYFQIDDGTKLTFGNQNQFDQWHWEGAGLNKLDIGNLTQGNHTITIYGREPGETVMLDQVFLTMDGNLVTSDDLFQSPTPVELVAFNAFVNAANKVELNWTTASELNNSGFYIEKSYNKSSWINLAFIKGNGTTTKKHSYKFIDNNNPSDLYYRIKQVDNNGSFTFSNTLKIEYTPQTFNLSQNYPNPFNPSTNIQYSINQTCDVKIDIYNLLGEKVIELKNEVQNSGTYELNWNASNYSSGTYLLCLYAKPSDGSNAFKDVRKMILLK